jgi:hypothetical protein
VKNLIECFKWVEAQICVASESRLKETEDEEERQGKSMQTAENKKRRGEREEKRREEKADKSARENREERTTSKRERSGRCCPFYNLLLGCPGTGPGNTGRRMEYYVHDPTRRNPANFLRHCTIEPYLPFKKPGIVTTVGLKESGAKSDG